MSRQHRNTHGGQNRLRIIGGQWRGRKLAFPNEPGLRPTPDRVRETLFNWLQGDIVGARCLDLFAGSGALGLEALSRGASRSVMVDAASAVCRQLDANLQLLRCDEGVVVHLSAERFLERGPGEARYDVVFIDPPFEQGLVEPIAQRLAAADWLAPGALIYVETERALFELNLPEDWQALREKHSGHVRYRLYRAPTA